MKALNELFELNLSTLELEKYSLLLGADCPFFIDNKAKLVEGIGEKMISIDLDLSNFEIRLINPGIYIYTKEAYNSVVPQLPKLSVEEIIEFPMNKWKNKLKNDFEDSVFLKHSSIKDIKNYLYKEGAVYASMSGSGSVVYGIFEK